MIYCAGYTVSFQEVPDEVSLVLLISDCQHKCAGCHSPELWDKTGEVLTTNFIDDLVKQYTDAISCVCFMGEGESMEETCKFARYIRDTHHLKTALYTGMTLIELSEFWFDHVIKSFNYFKVGPYIADLGGLDSPDTNQQMFSVQESDGILVNNITYKFTERKYKDEPLQSVCNS